MAVFRVQKTQNYTIMSNHHLRNKALSLKAKGLLSLMLSLPEDWDYTTRGLASICKEGVDSVCATVRELEAAGYIIRRRIRDKNGQMRGMEYTVLEQPQPPEQDEPSCAQPKQTEPKREKPVQENPAQLNTKEIKKEETNNVSNPIRAAGQRTEYRALLLKNIEYPILAQNNPMDTMRLDELVELMLDVVCSKRAAIRIAGENMPAEVVKSRFLKLNAEHIQYVLDCLKRSTFSTLISGCPNTAAVTAGQFCTGILCRLSASLNRTASMPSSPTHPMPAAAAARPPRTAAPAKSTAA